MSLLTWDIFLEYTVSYFFLWISLLQGLFAIASEMIQIYKMSTGKSSSSWKSYFAFQMKILYLYISSPTVKDTSQSKSHMKLTTAWPENTVKHACCFEATQASCFQTTHKRYPQQYVSLTKSLDFSMQLMSINSVLSVWNFWPIVRDFWMLLSSNNTRSGLECNTYNAM